MEKMQGYNNFDLSHEKKLTCDMGELIPFMCKEVVPGDVWRVHSNLFMRLIPQLAPFMHTVHAYVHFFFVPSRLVQKNFETFITKGFSGEEDIAWPYVVAPTGGFGKYSLADYFGLPVDVAGIAVDAKPFRGYDMIVNEWYLNENVQDYIEWSDGDGLDETTPLTVQKRNWGSDYFTSTLPFAQRGEPVYLPLGTTAPVVGNGNGLMLTDGTSFGYLGQSSTAANGTFLSSTSSVAANGTVTSAVATGMVNKVLGVAQSGDQSGLVADLRQASAITINEWRVANAVQRWMEKNARGGVRYIEFLFSHFGEKSSDARLQRPEYLGGGKSVIYTSEVLQTSATDSTSPQGNMAGHSMTGQKSMSFTRRFEEFGFVFGILSVLPRTQYQQGIERQWTRQTPLDYYFPSFAHLGAQAVLNKEIYAQGTADDEGVFGFQDRYQELRGAFSTVSGDFRDTLDYWTMTRKFDSLPQLNEQFVESNPTKRIFSVTNSKVCLVDIGVNAQVLRKLPKLGTPGLAA